MDRPGTGWQDPSPREGPLTGSFAFVVGQARRIDRRGRIALAVLRGSRSSSFSQPGSPRARRPRPPSPMRTGAHMAITLAHLSANTPMKRCTVYRLVSTRPVVAKELRYRFRWLPELSISPGMPALDRHAPALTTSSPTRTNGASPGLSGTSSRCA